MWTLTKREIEVQNYRFKSMILNTRVSVLCERAGGFRPLLWHHCRCFGGINSFLLYAFMMLCVVREVFIVDV